MKKWIGLLTVAFLAAGGYAYSQQVLPGADAAKVACAYTITPSSVATGSFVYAQCDEVGRIIVTNASGGSSGSTSTVTPQGGAFLVNQGTSPWVVTTSSGVQPTTLQNIPFVNLASATTGGCTPGKTLSAASTNATNIKNAAGTLCSLTAINTTPTVYYLKFYNTSASPTCNSDTVVLSYPVPANSSSLGGGVAVNLSAFGIAFSTGISLCLTGAIADNDNTSAAAGVAISYGYK